MRGDPDRIGVAQMVATHAMRPLECHLPPGGLEMAS
jgi:hypothetical protein